MSSSAKVRISINDQTVGTWITQNRQLREVLRISAEKVKANAEEMTPIGTSIKWGPIYRNGVAYYSHHHGYVRSLYRVRPYRQWYRVENTFRFFHLVEWGSVKNKPYAPLRRAGMASGTRFEVTPKGGSK